MGRSRFFKVVEMEMTKMNIKEEVNQIQHRTT
jgi:hypothetical protein